MTEGAFEGLPRGVARVPAPVRALANRSLRAFGMATADLRARPDFLLIGAKRAGTTTLYHALVRHPDVAILFPRPANIKSPHYLDLEHARGSRWYRSHFPLLRPPGLSRPVAGDADPYALYHPVAPRWAHEEAPDARILVLLRDPVERAFSHWWDRTKAGIETLPFADAIAAEEERLAGEEERLLADPETPRPAHEHWSYVDRGRYARQLARWLAVYPAGQLLVARSEDLYRRPADVYDRVLGFLGLAPFLPEEFGRHHSHRDRPGVDPAVRALVSPLVAGPNRELASLLGTPLWWDDDGATELPDLACVVPVRGALLAPGVR